jgi:hypothetical protein
MRAALQVEAEADLLMRNPAWPFRHRRGREKVGKRNDHAGQHDAEDDENLPS